jgi:hypothetical protein
MKSIFEQNDGSYSVVGDYHIPNLTAPNESETPLAYSSYHGGEDVDSHCILAVLLR